MNKNVISAFVLLCCLSISGCGKKYIDHFGDNIQVRNGKVTNTPERMIGSLRYVFIDYYEINKKYPENWMEVGESFIGGRVSHFSKEIKAGFKIDEPYVIIFYEDYKSKTKWYKYFIDKSDETGFLMHSENNCGTQDWSADEKSKWWYFADNERELKEIEKRKTNKKNKKFLFILSNEYKKTNALRELKFIQNLKAFDLLIEYIENTTESSWNRSVAVSSLDGFPKLNRFKNYIGRINSIISIETEIIKKIDRYPDWQEYNNHKFIITVLTELINIIEEKPSVGTNKYLLKKSVP